MSRETLRDLTTHDLLVVYVDARISVVVAVCTGWEQARRLRNTEEIEELLLNWEHRRLGLVVIEPFAVCVDAKRIASWQDR
jgi:hypothetical protein